MSSRRGRGHHEEEHENHERWAVSYADMVTVLMALFIVLFAISQVDQQKYIQLAQGLANGFGTSTNSPMPGGTGVVSAQSGVPNPVGLDANRAAPQPVSLNTTQNDVNRLITAQQKQIDQKNLELAEQELKNLIQVQKQLAVALQAKGLSDRVRFRITERGLVAAVVSDDVFFADASAQIQPTGVRVLDAVAPVLAKLPNNISVEGNTNHLRLRPSSQYASNWELSAARAASVVTYLVDRHGLAAGRMIVTGYGETRPLVPIRNPKAITANRRVDIVVLDGKPLAVRSLIPQLAAAQGYDTTDSSNQNGSTP